MQLRFSPMIGGHPSYVAYDMAVCKAKPAHSRPPHDKCHCGFNAWHEREVALEYHNEIVRHEESSQLEYGAKTSIRSTALLRVRLSGDVVEAPLNAMNLNKWGYRASRQLVTDVFFDVKCYLCDNEATGLGITRKAYDLRQAPRGTMLRPVRPTCRKHEVRIILPPQALMKYNDVGIHLGLPSE